MNSAQTPATEAESAGTTTCSTTSSACSTRKTITRFSAIASASIRLVMLDREYHRTAMAFCHTTDPLTRGIRLKELWEKRTRADRDLRIAVKAISSAEDAKR